MPMARTKTASARPRKSAASARPVAAAGVRLTHGERIVYPEGYSKADVANYYAAVLPKFLEGIRGRPLSVVRCPDGISGECFFQKHAIAGLKRVRHVRIREQSGTLGDYLYVEKPDEVMELVQFNAIEFHLWAATVTDLDRTDYAVFDLDPAPGVEWNRTAAAAKMVRDVCKRAQLTTFVRTTGGKGLHVVVPLRPAVSWSAAKEFSRALAEGLVRAYPKEFIATASKAQRRGKIFVDYLRNARGATSIASYSLRARSGAAVAMPLRWKDMDRLDDPAELNIRSVPARLRRLRSDPWKGFSDVRQGLPKLQPS
jgi:bifunctional non-homologous end joining protein LigD